MDKYNPIAFYHNGYAPIAKGDKVVFLDKNGEEAFTNSKMESDGCYEINDGKTVFRRDNRYGLHLYRRRGALCARNTYRWSMQTRTATLPQRHFKFGVIDAKGDVVIDFEYSGLKQTSVVADRYFCQRRQFVGAYQRERRGADKGFLQGAEFSRVACRRVLQRGCRGARI